MCDKIAAHGRGDGRAHDLQELVEKARNEGSLLRHGRPQRLNPNRLDTRRFKRRLSGEIESEKVMIPRKMNAQPRLIAKCGFRKTALSAAPATFRRNTRQNQQLWTPCPTRASGG